MKNQAFAGEVSLRLLVHMDISSECTDELLSQSSGWCQLRKPSWECSAVRAGGTSCC